MSTTVDGSKKDYKKFVPNEWSKRARKIKKKEKGKKYFYIYYKQHPHSDSEGWIAEHRLVLENILGRYLETFEHVHHLNNDGLDNRKENLELHTNSSHLLAHHIERRKIKRKCVRCGTNKPPLSSKTHKGYRYWYPRWHRNPENKKEWVCESCYNKIKRRLSK